MKKFLAIPLTIFVLAFAGCNDRWGVWSPFPEFEQNVLLIVTVQTWAGLDLQDSFFEFEEGDEIYIKGMAVSRGSQNNIQVHIHNMGGGGWAPIGGWNPIVDEGDGFEQTITLVDTDLTGLATASPPCLRLRTNKVNGSMVIEELIVTKADGTVMLTLSEVLADAPLGLFAGSDIGAANVGLQAAGSDTDVIFEVLGP